MTNQGNNRGVGGPRKMHRLGVALYVMLLTVLLASVFHGLTTLSPL